MIRYSLTLLSLHIFSQSADAIECAIQDSGSSVPAYGGNPRLISEVHGTVISANFFASGAIQSPHRDGLEAVTICVSKPDAEGLRSAEIVTDVGLDNNYHVKAYPEIIIGSKFGNQYETSYRYYSNTGLPPEHQWPVRSTELDANGQPYEFGNLEYVSQTLGVGLPAFTNALPLIDITLDLDEANIIGAERDVMLESWFHHTGMNADVIGNDSINNLPIANTLNNIVGSGHRHYPALNNTVLEMMVHIGPLSPNDVSRAANNPGQQQLTENFSGTDSDGDGIDDHFDVDSHVNANSNRKPSPGIYSSGVDANADGIDDADILPIEIGNYVYSIWYGQSHIAPIIVYSRETNSSKTSNFDPLTADMNLTAEGEIQLRWNDFLDYTLNSLEPLLQSAGVAWVTDANANPFPSMRSSSGAVSGLEFGVEVQTNNANDQPYIATVNKYDVTIDGMPFGLNAPVGTPFIAKPAAADALASTGQRFTWSANHFPAVIDRWWLYLGSTAGANDLYDSADLAQATQITVPTIQTSSAAVHARLWYQSSAVSSAWRFVDSEYTIEPNVNSVDITSPIPQSILSASQATFTWSAVAESWLYIGSSLGGREFVDSGNLGSATSHNAQGLPLDGSTLYVRLWYRRVAGTGTWLYVDELYSATTAAQPLITQPTVNTEISGSQVEFQWQHTVESWLYVGTTLGGQELHNSGNLQASTSAVVDNLPQSQTPLFVRLWYRENSGQGRWLYLDYEYNYLGTGSNSD